MKARRPANHSGRAIKCTSWSVKRSVSGRRFRGGSRFAPKRSEALGGLGAAQALLAALERGVRLRQRQRPVRHTRSLHRLGVETMRI